MLFLYLHYCYEQKKFSESLEKLFYVRGHYL